MLQRHLCLITALFYLSSLMAQQADSAKKNATGRAWPLPTATLNNQAPSSIKRDAIPVPGQVATGAVSGSDTLVLSSSTKAVK